MSKTLGVDVACRAAHQGSLAVDGRLIWTGRRFFTRPADLERLWADLDLEDPAELTVVVEPTRNAWIVVAAWFRRRGAKVVMVPTTQSADLRAYYSKHAKNDRLDSALLARLPLLHPEGLREFTGDGPADPLRRLTKQRSSIVKRRTAVLQRLDALLELLGPAWYEVLGSNYGKAALMLLARYGDPHALIRLGQARLMDALGLTSGTVSVRLARLEQRAVVVREPDPDDKRSFTVRLTQQGLDLFDHIAPAHLESEDLLLSALAPEERQNLADLLRKLLSSFENTGSTASRVWGMTLEPARVARRRRTAVGLSDQVGLLVTHVQPDTPAHLAAIRTGDLLTARDAQPVRTPEDLTVGGSPVRLTVLRGERALDLSLDPGGGDSGSGDSADGAPGSGDPAR